MPNRKSQLKNKALRHESRNPLNKIKAESRPLKIIFELKDKLKNASRVALLGIGSELRADDASGMLVAQRLEKDLCADKNFKCFLGGASPENFTGAIKGFKPQHLLIIDSADLGKKPGTVQLINEEDIAGVSFSTHRLPTKILVDYLKTSMKCEFVFIGIQPKTLKFGESVSKEVLKAVDLISDSIQEILKSRVAGY